MDKFILWCVNSTLTIVVVSFVSFFLGYGELGSYANSVFVLVLGLGYIFTRGRAFLSQWIQVFLASLSGMSVAAMSLTLVSVLRNPDVASQEWFFVSILVVSIAILCAFVCLTSLSFTVALELKLKFSKVVLAFLIQGCVYYFTLAYGSRIVLKLVST